MHQGIYDVPVIDHGIVSINKTEKMFISALYFERYLPANAKKISIRASSKETSLETSISSSWQMHTARGAFNS